uniref:Uncharacterized protein n=1 Tax=Marseillevirus LCMAC201 TaxID=2506605 RepID=A0A481YW74_9VIRU|nr:MAG: hypothetical protein LCMAC201_03380 [Marseillevirus LCMAC201]
MTTTTQAREITTQAREITTQAREITIQKEKQEKLDDQKCVKDFIEYAKKVITDDQVENKMFTAARRCDNHAVVHDFKRIAHKFPCISDNKNVTIINQNLNKHYIEKYGIKSAKFSSGLYGGTYYDYDYDDDIQYADLTFRW